MKHNRRSDLLFLKEDDEGSCVHVCSLNYKFTRYVSLRLLHFRSFFYPLYHQTIEEMDIIYEC